MQHDDGMVTLGFLLSFRSLPAVGHPTNSIVPSDTLAAALGWAAAEMGQYDLYADALIGGMLAVSSVFPRLGSRLLYPLYDLRGRLLWVDEDGRPPGVRRAAWERKCAVVCRLAGDADVFYWATAGFELDGKVLAGAHFLARLPRGLSGAFASWVRALGDAGIGGGRSAGGGGFEVERVEEVPPRAAGRPVLLSVAVPETPGAPAQYAAFLWARREGYTDWRWRGAPDMRKAGIVALLEGQVVGRPLAGRVVELDGRRCLYCGRAFLRRIGR